MPDSSETNFLDTLKSLIVAFVLAMTFRAFVTEGFVIPTGSMAPTLLGKHVRVRSEQTGFEFPMGVDPRWGEDRLGYRFAQAADPMLGPQYPGSGTAGPDLSEIRAGDRILVHKSLYPFKDPDRFDVVVFKNPTNPNGADGNYIKRLVGLPNEAIWLVDGDVFVAPIDDADDVGAYGIRRKPDHVQRTVWQPVHRSDDPVRYPSSLDVPWQGPPWHGSDAWVLDAARGYRCSTDEPTQLEWDSHVRQVQDWAPYNQLGQDGVHQPGSIYVSDVRVAATIVPDADGLETTFELEAANHVFQWRISGDEVTLRMRGSVWGDDPELAEQGWRSEGPFRIHGLRAGRPLPVEFWHADQRIAFFIDGDLLAEMTYDWLPLARLQNATNIVIDDPDQLALRDPGAPPQFRWRFAGSPVTLYRVEVDRDIVYRTGRIDRRTQERNPTNEGFEERVEVGHFAAATHPRNVARLGPDQFFMLGDNSRASSDSRLWCNPHPLVAVQVDAAPFVVHRSLLLGKAWVVYFPSPLPLRGGGSKFVPDFGRLRFIR